MFEMEYGNLTPRQKLTKARVTLNKEKPFFGYLTMRLVFTEDNRIPSIGVDKHGNCYYNKDFIAGLPQFKVNSVLCHEVMHCAFKHLENYKGKDLELLNISQDAVINGLLIEDGMSLPEGGVLPNSNGTLKIMNVEIPDVHKKSHMEVYDRLYDAWKKQKDKQKKELHDMLMDSHIRKDDKNNTGSSVDANVDWEKELVEASTFAKMMGSLPAGIKRAIDELLENVIDWRGLLYKYITNSIPYDYTWRRPNKKSYATGIYMPDIVKEKIDVICSIDTSGSISSKELQVFSSELLGIINSFENVELTIIYNDTQVYGPHRLMNPTPEDIKRLKPKGGGGTDHVPVFEWISKNNSGARLVICFTDGYTTFPNNSPIDTIWVLAGNHCNKDRIPFGRVIELPRES